MPRYFPKTKIYLKPDRYLCRYRTYRYIYVGTYLYYYIALIKPLFRLLNYYHERACQGKEKEEVQGQESGGYSGKTGDDSGSWT